MPEVVVREMRFRPARVMVRLPGVVRRQGRGCVWWETSDGGRAARTGWSDADLDDIEASALADLAFVRAERELRSSGACVP